MNIFYTSHITKECAINLDNKRLSKMILESAQILCTAIRINYKDNYDYLLDRQLPCKSSHIHHPCVKWAALTSSNAQWLFDHFVDLNREFNSRFSHWHKYVWSKDAIRILLLSYIPLGPFTCPPNCTKFKHLSDKLSINEIYKIALVDKWNNDKRRPKWGPHGSPFDVWNSVYCKYLNHAQ